jgi:hypothetical protein
LCPRKGYALDFPLERGISAMDMHSIELRLCVSVQFRIISYRGNKWPVSQKEVSFIAMLDLTL